MRLLGMIMLVVGAFLCGAAYYLIEVGGFPANKNLACGVWGAVAVIGLIILATRRPKRKTLATRLKSKEG